MSCCRSVRCCAGDARLDERASRAIVRDAVADRTPAGATRDRTSSPASPGPVHPERPYVLGNGRRYEDLGSA
jgi:hypothetical protein